LRLVAGDWSSERMSGHWRRGAIGGLVAVAATLFATPVAADERTAAGSSDIVVQALSLLGTPYRYGGTSPDTGFDCSGLVRHVYSVALDRHLPRRSEEMVAIGRPVSRADLQPGDLVFFNTLRRAFSHVAIYIGEGRFVHAPARRGRVRIEGLDDRYWAARFDGARRLLDPDDAGSTGEAGGARASATSPAGWPAVWDDRPPGP
jgi:cell wall-associated NlpC family hydrolase